MYVVVILAWIIMAVLMWMGVDALQSIAKSMRTLVEQEIIQDIHDLSVVAERREEKTVDMEEMKDRLKEDK